MGVCVCGVCCCAHATCVGIPVERFTKAALSCISAKAMGLCEAGSSTPPVLASSSASGRTIRSLAMAFLTTSQSRLSPQVREGEVGGAHLFIMSPQRGEVHGAVAGRPAAWYWRGGHTVWTLL